MKDFMKSTEASSFSWVAILICGFIFALIFAVLYDISMPLIEYSKVVNVNDSMRDFYVNGLLSLLPVIFIITMIYRLISNSQREGER